MVPPQGSNGTLWKKRIGQGFGIDVIVSVLFRHPRGALPHPATLAAKTTLTTGLPFKPLFHPSLPLTPSSFSVVSIPFRSSRILPHIDYNITTSLSYFYTHTPIFSFASKREEASQLPSFQRALMYRRTSDHNINFNDDPWWKYKNASIFMASVSCVCLVPPVPRRSSWLCLRCLFAMLLRIYLESALHGYADNWCSTLETVSK